MGKLKPAPIKYYVADAFAEEQLKGNAAAVIVLDNEKDEAWMQAVAREFNISATVFLTKVPSSTEIAPIANGGGVDNGNGHQIKKEMPRYTIRWFAPHAELNLCGHGSIASAHVLFSTGMVKDSKTIEFISPSAGLLTATRIDKVVDKSINKNGTSDHGAGIVGDDVVPNFLVQLGFPLIPTVELDLSDKQFLPKSLLGPNNLNMVKMSFGGDLLVEVASSKDVVALQPILDEYSRWPGRGVIVTGATPPGSDFDFFSRTFLPNSGIPEDPVCGSIHCSLAPYWSKKLGKSTLRAFMASPRSGVLELQVLEDKKLVYIGGSAALVMEGNLYA